MSNVVVLKRAMERVEVDSSCVTVEILRRTFRVSSVVLRILCTYWSTLLTDNTTRITGYNTNVIYMRHSEKVPLELYSN